MADHGRFRTDPKSKIAHNSFLGAVRENQSSRSHQQQAACLVLLANQYTRLPNPQPACAKLCPAVRVLSIGDIQDDKSTVPGRMHYLEETGQGTGHLAIQMVGIRRTQM